MQIDTNRPHVWTTFQGKPLTVSEMDHQHLSNIYWFHLIFWERKMQWAIDEIENRFNGQILHYRPHIKFEAEIKFLEERGLIRWTTEENDPLMKTGVISFRGQIIGAIHQPIN